MTGDQLARRAAEAMFARDRASQSLGMAIEEVREGYARLRMTVRPDMLNGHGACHGGFIFALADSAFAFSCNSRNRATVAAGADIEYLASVREGEVLVAEGQERSLGGRLGVYDITVRRADGTAVALFRGRSYGLKAAVIEGQPPP
jgi:acyl-CoA thioesterase